MKLLENSLTFNVKNIDGSEQTSIVDVSRALFARHTSRDTATTTRILDGVRDEGYHAHLNPSICGKSRYLLTQEDAIEVQGRHTSGEVEIVAITGSSGLLISVGSDHNDRSLEYMWTEALGKIFDSAKSKQMVPAVVAREAWRYEDVEAHWDRLVLRSYVTVDGSEIPYQEFELEKLIHLETHLVEDRMRDVGSVLFGGTASPLPTVPANVFQFGRVTEDTVFPLNFRFEVYDPIVDRTIPHGYEVRPIEEIGSLSL